MTKTKPSLHHLAFSSVLFQTNQYPQSCTAAEGAI